MRRRYRRRRRSMTGQLLDDSYEIRILARKVELLSQSISQHRVETILKYRDLVDVQPVLTMSFVESAFKFSYISMKRVYALLESIQLILCFLYLVWIVIDMYKLVENRIIIIGHLVGLGQLRKHYSLDMQVEVKIDIVELDNSIANCSAVDLQLGSN